MEKILGKVVDTENALQQPYRRTLLLNLQTGIERANRLRYSNLGDSSLG